MDRREFIKSSFAVLLLTSLSKQLPFQEEIVTIVEIDLTNGWEDAIRYGAPKIIDGEYQLPVEVDLEQLYPYVVAICDNGETFHTIDGGRTWVYSDDPND